MSESTRGTQDCTDTEPFGGWEADHQGETRRFVHEDTDEVIEIAPSMPHARPSGFDDRAVDQRVYRILVRAYADAQAHQYGSDQYSTTDARHTALELMREHPNGDIPMRKLEGDR